MFVLRDYQEQAVRVAASRFGIAPAGSLLLALPPAAGKTAIGSRVFRTMVYEQGLHGLAIAHRREIVDGIYAQMLRDGIPENDVGVIMADEGSGQDGRERLSARIQVASIDTLRARGMAPEADMLWSDECHLDAADDRGAFVTKYRAGGTFVLGTTATPVRLDGRGFRDLYDRLEVVVQPGDLVRGGHISEPRVWTVPPALLPRLTRRPKKGDFTEKEAAAAANRPVLIGSIVDHWKKRAKGLRTLCFAVNVEHSRSIVQRFREAGIAAEHLDGNATPAERRQVLDNLRSGATKVVCSCMLLTAGVDLPSVRCVILARPTQSLQLHVQMCGRVFRLWKGQRPIILDHAGNYARRGPNGVLGDPLMRRDWTLDGGEIGTDGEAPSKACECGAVVPAGCATCPVCGAAFAVAVEPEEDATAELVRLEDAQRAKIEAEVRAVAAKMKDADEEWIQKVIDARMGRAA